MNPDLVQELLEVFFIVFTDDEEVGQHSSPIIATCDDFKQALFLAFQRLSTLDEDEQDMTVSALSPATPGRVLWTVEAGEYLVYIEAMRLNGKGISDELSNWLREPARLQTGLA